MKWISLAALLLAVAGGCRGPGRSAAMEHWFPLAHEHPGKGVNTRSKPPCPYFDPPPKGGEYAFCHECGVLHTQKTP